MEADIVIAVGLVGDDGDDLAVARQLGPGDRGRDQGVVGLGEFRHHHTPDDPPPTSDNKPPEKPTKPPPPPLEPPPQTPMTVPPTLTGQPARRYWTPHDKNTRGKEK